jgi:glycosyltransferase involved in cell wall biosynthesis
MANREAVNGAEPRRSSRRGRRTGGARPTVLYVCHNHPSVRPGGAEAYALELFRAVRASDELDAVFLAKGGPPLSPVGRPHLGTCVTPTGTGDAEYFFYTDDYNDDYDWTLGTFSGSKELATKHFREFLLAVRPDVVHFQHTMFFGYDVLRVTRDTLPDVPILYTLHEFMPICHRQGQLVRVGSEQPCLEESPRRCHECYPGISPQTFFLRKRFVQSHLSLVDQFIAPSRFLRDRYVEWGIPPEKVLCEEYGRDPAAEPVEEEERAERTRVGFFGQFTPFKGVDVLLEAMGLLLEDAGGADSTAGRAHAWVHGSNLDLQPGEFQNRFGALLGATDNITLVGRYDHRQIAQLMANVDWVIVPSIWWENSPLVIQEAFYYGRPVICSDIGGMAEKVEHGVNGLHFRAGDPRSLARTIRQAVDDPALWERLRAGIPELYRMEVHVAVLADQYRGLIAERRANAS